MLKIKKSQEFQELYKLGKKCFGHYGLIYIKKSKDLHDKNKYGFVVSKKNGNAPTRNRIKRLFREFCRLHDKDFKQGYDIIIISKRTCGTQIDSLKYSDVEKDLLKIFKKVGLFL